MIRINCTISYFSSVLQFSCYSHKAILHHMAGYYTMEGLHIIVSEKHICTYFPDKTNLLTQDHKLCCKLDGQNHFQLCVLFIALVLVDIMLCICILIVIKEETNKMILTITLIFVFSKEMRQEYRITSVEHCTQFIYNDQLEFLWNSQKK